MKTKTVYNKYVKACFSSEKNTPEMLPFLSLSRSKPNQNRNQSFGVSSHSIVIDTYLNPLELERQKAVRPHTSSKQ